MIELKNVRSGYIPGIDIIQGISTTFADGEISSIIGPNGAGKSTLLKTIFGFATLNQGTIQYNGKDLTRYGPEEMLSDIGFAYIPQERSIFPDLTVHENIELGAWTIRKDVEKREAGFDRVYNQFPALEEKRQKRAKTLSGGQQRMLEIARSLVTNPEVVLVDEPSVGLAPDLAKSVYDSIEKLPENNVTVILVDQNVEAAVEAGDTLYIIDQGQLSAKEPTDEMSERIESIVTDWISIEGYE